MKQLILALILCFFSQDAFAIDEDIEVDAFSKWATTVTFCLDGIDHWVYRDTTYDSVEDLVKAILQNISKQNLGE